VLERHVPTTMTALQKPRTAMMMLPVRILLDHLLVLVTTDTLATVLPVPMTTSVLRVLTTVT
jgi:hypothetical protein